MPYKTYPNFEYENGFTFSASPAFSESGCIVVVALGQSAAWRSRVIDYQRGYPYCVVFQIEFWRLHLLVYTNTIENEGFYD